MYRADTESREIICTQLSTLYICMYINVNTHVHIINMYTVKESGHNNVHVHLCKYMHEHVLCMCIMYIHTTIQFNSHNE